MSAEPNDRSGGQLGPQEGPPGPSPGGAPAAGGPPPGGPHAIPQTTRYVPQGQVQQGYPTGGRSGFVLPAGHPGTATASPPPGWPRTPPPGSHPSSPGYPSGAGNPSPAPGQGGTPAPGYPHSPAPGYTHPPATAYPGPHASPAPGFRTPAPGGPHPSGAGPHPSGAGPHPSGAGHHSGSGPGWPGHGSGSGAGAVSGQWTGPLPSTDNLPPGTVVEDTYEIVQKLGQGGMGAVYKARHRLLEKDVALKVIASHMAQDARFRARFLREAKVAMEFVHRHAVQIRHFAITREGICYMTMDFSPGESLQGILKREGALPPRRAAKILRQILEAVAEAHRKKIIHRDLKPDNVIVEKDGEDDWVKVLDFGLAKGAVEPGAQELTIGEGNDRIVGTPAYMSPEQACGEDADHRSDLYSCGIILYQLLCGQVPFTAPSASAVMRKQVSVPPPPLRKVKADLDLPEGLEEVVMRALAKEPVERFQSADQFAFALERYAGERPAPGSTLASQTGGLTALDASGMSTRTQEITGSLTGMTIDRYKILAPLGEGGMGTVYKAEHILTHRTCAFKVIKTDLTSNPEAITRFQREAQISSKFKHPSAVEVYDFGRLSDAMFFLSLEYVKGKPMTERLEKGPLPVEDCVEITTQALAALGAAHRAGIVHRDLKPDNIMLGEVDGWRNQVKILDFGIAKMQDAQGDAGRLKTAIGVFFGTPRYASPEQCSGQSVDARSDIYTFGVILYEMLTGRPPFDSDTPQGYLGQHMAMAPQRIKVFNPQVEVPAAVEAVVLRSLAKDPGERFQTAEEFIAALQEAAGYAPRFDATEQGLKLAAEMERPRGNPLLIVGSGVLAVIAAVAIWLGLAGGGQRTGATFSPVPADAEVVLLAPDGAEVAGTQNAQGRWVFEGISPGAYRVKISREGYEPVERPVSVEAGRVSDTQVTLPKSRVEERKRAEAALAAAREAKRSAIDAGADRAPSEALSRGDGKIAEAETALAGGKYDLVVSLAETARDAFAEASAGAVAAAREQAQLTSLASQLDSARAAAERAAARSLAQSVMNRAEAEERAGREAMGRAERANAILRLRTALSLFQEAASSARVEADRRLDEGRREYAEAKAEYARQGAAATDAAYAEAESARQRSEAANAAGDPLEAVRALEQAIERMRAAARSADQRAAAARFGKALEDAAQTLTTDTRRSREARAAAEKAGAAGLAAEGMAAGEAADAAAEVAIKSAAELLDRGAARLTDEERALVLERHRAASAKRREARDQYLRAESAAVLESTRRTFLEGMNTALAKAEAARAAYVETLAVAEQKKADLARAKERAAEAETSLGLARAKARAAALPGAEVGQITQAGEMAARAGELFQQASAAAESAALAASSGSGQAEGTLALVEFTLKAFKKAMEEKNVDALGKCFVDFSNLRPGYRSFFQGSKVISIAYTPPLITGDDSAEATVTMTVTEGSRRGNPSRTKLIFGRFGGGFKIASLEKVD